MVHRLQSIHITMTGYFIFYCLDAGSDDPYQVLLGRFGETGIGSTIAEESSHGVSGDFVKRYLSDFIHMEHPSKSEDEMWVSHQNCPVVVCIDINFHHLDVLPMGRIQEEVIPTYCIIHQCYQWVGAYLWTSNKTADDLGRLYCNQQTFLGSKGNKNNFIMNSAHSARNLNRREMQINNSKRLFTSWVCVGHRGKALFCNKIAGWLNDLVWKQS